MIKLLLSRVGPWSNADFPYVKQKLSNFATMNDLQNEELDASVNEELDASVNKHKHTQMHVLLKPIFNHNINLNAI